MGLMPLTAAVFESYLSLSLTNNTVRFDVAVFPHGQNLKKKCNSTKGREARTKAKRQPFRFLPQPHPEKKQSAEVPELAHTASSKRRAMYPKGLDCAGF